MFKNKLIYNFIVLSTITFIFLISSCAENPYPLGTPEHDYKKAKVEEKKATEQVEKTLSKAPNWFNNPPSNPKMLYFTGDAVHPNLNTSRRLAIINSKVIFADAVEGELSERFTRVSKTIQSTSYNVSDFEQDVTEVLENVIDKVKIKGWLPKKYETLAEGPNYHTYSMIEIPKSEFVSLLMSEVAKKPNLEAEVNRTKAFEDLEDELVRAKIQ